MEFKKVTISLPKNLHDKGMCLINKGLFSNFSDLVRSGIRGECNELQELARDFDKKVIYADKKLLSGVKQSMKEARDGKGRILKSDKDVDRYFEAL